MKLSYSKLIELFEQENIPDIIGYIDDFSLLANSLIKKGEFDKLDKILKLSLQYEVLDNHIPYYQLFEAINSLNTIESETAYNELVQYFIRNKDERLYSLLLEHINLALFKYSDFENASKYIKIYLEHFPNDYVCLKYSIYCQALCNNKHEFYLRVSKLHDLGKVKAIVNLHGTYKEQYESIEFIVEACYQAIQHYKEIIDYLNIIDIINTLVTFFPSQYKERFEIVMGLANKFKEAQLFSDAIPIYQSLIRNDYKCSTCYWMILLCKRGCVTDADLVKAGKPFGNMAEYRNVLDECIKEGISADGYKTILKNTQKRKKSTFVNIFVFFTCLGIFIAFIILAIRYGFLD